MAWTAAELRAHIQHAVQLELFTIPAYLCAHYSIDEKNSKAAESAADELLEIVNEEMLHLQQLCNLSNALGQAPKLTGAAAPSFPGRVPYNSHDILVALGPATEAQLRAFMTIELPTWNDPYDAPDLPPQDRYETIGEFYHALMFGLGEVYGDGCEPWPASKSPQIHGNFGQDDFPITDLDSARRALELVIRQGEGGSKVDPHGTDPGELAHYYKLQAILETLGPGDVRPMISNTAGITYSARCGALLDFFDACYSVVLQKLEASFHGQARIGEAVGLMFAVLQVLSTYVVGVPHQAKDAGEPGDQTLTPRFRYTTVTPAQAYKRLDAEDRDGDAIASAARALQIIAG